MMTNRCPNLTPTYSPTSWRAKRSDRAQQRATVRVLRVLRVERATR
jgi:hypothetical protein